MESRFVPLGEDEITREWEATWGIPVVSVHREYLPGDVTGRALVDDAGEVLGVVTWLADGDTAEIVTVNAHTPGRHIGGRLLASAEAELRAIGVSQVTLVTTNDNLPAQAFYVRHGYRITRLHLDAMQRVRRVKPSVPALGIDGIPLRDMLELEKEL